MTNLLHFPALRAAAIALSVFLASSHLAQRELAAQEASAEAGTEKAGEGSAETAATHDQLRALRDQFIQAVNDKNVDAILALLDPNVVLTTQDDLELKSIRGREGVRAYVERMLTGPKHAIDSLKIEPTVDELTILYNDDTGVAFGSSKDHYRRVDGSDFDLAPRWSATVVKTSGEWKIANLQTTLNMFDNPVLATLLRRVAMLAAGSLAAGVVLGVVLGRTLFKRRAA